MAEWLVEEGIGEERAILVDRGRIVAARIEWDEPLRAGLVAEARLIAKAAGSRRGMVRFADGNEALVAGLPADASEGSLLTVEITRASIAERGRNKLPQCRPTSGSPRLAPGLAAVLRADGLPVSLARPADGRFEGSGWDELVEEALGGTIAFAGGTLTVSPTPAMTLIDIDGDLPPRQLALAAVPAIAAALGRLDLAGSVGIDFPTLEARADRQAVDTALASALQSWRGERTAMNGFGFVQLVSRLERPSLVSRFARAPSAAAARMLLRAAEKVSGPGVLLLTARPAIRAAMRPEWEAELSRRTGLVLRWQEDAALALAGGFAQAVPQ